MLAMRGCAGSDSYRKAISEIDGGRGRHGNNSAERYRKGTWAPKSRVFVGYKVERLTFAPKGGCLDSQKAAPVTGPAGSGAQWSGGHDATRPCASRRPTLSATNSQPCLGIVSHVPSLHRGFFCRQDSDHGCVGVQGKAQRPELSASAASRANKPASQGHLERRSRSGH